MAWKNLRSVLDLDVIVAASKERPQLIFKHSTRCSISAAAKHRLEQSFAQLSNRMEMHFLDLLMHRDVSNAIAARLGIRHESPQAILLRNGQPSIHLSHYDIEAEELMDAAEA